MSETIVCSHCQKEYGTIAYCYGRIRNDNSECRHSLINIIYMICQTCNLLKSHNNFRFKVGRRETFHKICSTWRA